MLDHKGNDGDSFALQCGNQKFILRLYFVDAPETDQSVWRARASSRRMHFGVSIDETLKAGIAGEATWCAMRWAGRSSC